MIKQYCFSGLGLKLHKMGSNYFRKKYFYQFCSLLLNVILDVLVWDEIVENVF